MATGADLTRRALLQVSAAATALRIAPARAAADPAAFHADDFAIVGIYDVDWLLDPPYLRLLDTLAASPGAVRGVRVFGALSSGARERVNPEGSGTVWPAPDQPMDFAPTLRALDSLVERGLVPFLPLAFFPAAVSPSPIEPPGDFANWQRLVRSFLDAVVERYGAARIAEWWFEVWNEPNMPPFWRGGWDRYLDLYRATSAAAAGHRVRLGGPAIAYHDEGPALIERFAAFLAAEPDVRCDFVSFHRKGIWGPHEAEPLLARSVDAAQRTADALLRLAPGRAQGMWIVNNEADMKVGFDTPYEPRMTEQFPAYLAAQAIEYARLTSRHAAHGMRFVASSDNANQHLVQAPFDGRRSLMTPLSSRLDDLVKLPVWHFYELLRLMGSRLGDPATADPDPTLFHIVTASEDCVAALFTTYAVPAPAPRVVEVVLRAPWPRVNIATFRINAEYSNAFTAAGRHLGISDSPAPQVRAAGELAGTLRSGVDLPGGELRETIALGPYATVLVWITPHRADAPTAPSWLQAMAEAGRIVLRWTPAREADFHGYELLRRTGDSEAQSVAPAGLRGSAWVDAAPPPGAHAYGVRVITTSGMASPVVWSAPVTL